LRIQGSGKKRYGHFASHSADKNVLSIPKENAMRKASSAAIPISLLCALSLFFVACGSTPPPPPKSEAINNSDVYKLAQDALQPIVDQFITAGDRILLAPMPAFSGVDAWRYVPAPLEVKQEDYEGIIKPKAQKLFKPSPDSSGTVPEVKLLGELFSLDSANKVYKLNTASNKYDGRLLGRALAGTGYSGLGAFSLASFAKANPYFIDSFESGLLSAALKRSGKGFERLSPDAMNMGDLPLESRKRQDNPRKAELVFNTNMLGFNTWAEIQDAYKPNGVTKLLMYSVNNVVSSGAEYIGIQVSFRLVDIAKGGKLLWSGTKSIASEAFPKEKIPFLGTVKLSLDAKSVMSQRDALALDLKGQGIRSMNAVLVKIDDIPVLGSYPVTREDFAIESALEDYFSSVQLSPISKMAIQEKLYPRQYKESWQIAHAVHYVNPLLGGDYGQFANYYGAQYMIGYRVLWKDIQGVQILEGEKDLELNDKVLGIYFKVMDMAANGRVVISDFLKLGEDSDLEANVLYHCFNRTKSFDGLAKALSASSVVNGGTRTALVNRRMEIANNYVGEGTLTEDFLKKRFPQGNDQIALMMAYYDAYEVLRTFGETKEKPSSSGGTDKEETWTQAQELNMSVAVGLMQSWFEDGLCCALASSDAAPNEKLESLYSRYLLQPSQGQISEEANSPEAMVYLSPLYLSKWGSAAPIKSYYGIDKIIYFSLLESGADTEKFVRPPSSSPISRFFPLISTDPDSLQVSVVNVSSGDYEFKQNFALK
jgi:hypothetical protein